MIGLRIICKIDSKNKPPSKGDWNLKISEISWFTKDAGTGNK